MQLQPQNRCCKSRPSACIYTEMIDNLRQQVYPRMRQAARPKQKNLRRPLKDIFFFLVLKHISREKFAPYRQINYFLYSYILKKIFVGRYIFRFRFYCPSRLFYSLWAKPIVRWSENGRSPRITIWPPASRTWLGSHVTWARIEPPALRWRAI